VLGTTYIIDSSSIIEIFRRHPVEIYPDFWKKFNEHFDDLLKTGRMRIIHYVYDEILYIANGNQCAQHCNHCFS